MKNETVAIIGYGVQDRPGAEHARQWINVIVGRKRILELCKAWRTDGCRKTLFSLEEAAERGTMIQYLGLRRRAVACGRDQALPQERRRALLLSRVRHRLPEQTGIVAPDSSTSSWSPQRDLAQRARQLPFGQRDQLFFAFNQDATAGPPNAPSPPGLPSVGIPFPTTFEKKSTLTDRDAVF